MKLIPRTQSVVPRRDHWRLDSFELIEELPELEKHIRRIAAAEDEYMPSGPPMSPLTRSYFWHWALYDLSIGIQRRWAQFFSR